MNGRSTISSPVHDKKSDKMLVYFTVPVKNQQGIQGALMGSRKASDVEREVLGARTIETANIIVDDRQIITFTTLMQSQRSYSNNVWDAIADSGINFPEEDLNAMKADLTQGVSGKFQIDGTDYYIAYTPVSVRPGWTLVSFISNKEYYIYRRNIYIISLGSIFLFDIHNFKLINHNYSYQQGDKVLCCIADTLAEIAMKKERISRQTSDCFAILMEKEKFDEHAIMSQLLDAIHTQLGAGIAGAIRFSAGFYEVADRQEDVRNMVDKATIAWKYAKEKEESCMAYNDTILMDQLKVKQIEDSQVEALRENEFKVYLQPKVDLCKNTICGAEALVRWISKELGFMAPDEFIPIVEANGFIKEIDFYVFEQVCKDIRHRLDKQEKVITVSINQSRITILDDHYIERVQSTIEQYQIPVKYLDFEVTESLFIGDYKTIIQILTKVHQLGISISMDDFGSGYSSLNLLKNMSIDNLKIDKEFLAESEKSVQSRIIIKSLIEMARELDIRVVCEGVEQKEQVEFLRMIQCDEAQGYYYDRPISSEEFYRKLSEGRYEDLRFDTKPYE